MSSLSPGERAGVRGKAACNCQGLGALPGVELCFSSLSPGERARVRGKAACNCQGLGALPGVELCFSSLIGRQ